MKILCLFILTFVAVAANRQTAAQTIKPGDITEIFLSTGDGFCFDCGRITTLRSDGTATYHGEKNSRVRKGDFSGAIGSAEFARLAETFAGAGFFDFKPLYEGTTSDVASVVITVVNSGGRKTVENFGRSDEPRLKFVERAFNEAAAKIKWRDDKLKVENQPPAETDAFAHLEKTHAAVVKKHIDTIRKNVRPALATDGENLDELELMREIYGANYHPYYAIYDFDKNEIEDFAVVLFDAKAKPEARFSLVVFKGAANNVFKRVFTVPKTDLSLGGIEIEALEEGRVELRIVYFQTEQGCSVLRWRNRKLVLTLCDGDEN